MVMARKQGIVQRVREILLCGSESARESRDGASAICLFGRESARLRWDGENGLSGGEAAGGAGMEQPEFAVESLLGPFPNRGAFTGRVQLGNVPLY